MKKKRLEVTREEILKLLKKERKPLSSGQMADVLALRGKEKKELKVVLKGLLRDGSVMGLKGNRFAIPAEINLETGTLWCTRSGNGFVIPDKEGRKDIYVPSRYMNTALHGDRVMVRVEHSWRGKKEGKVVGVVQRKIHTVVGFVRRFGQLTYLVPEDERIGHHFILHHNGPKEDLQDEDLVAARIISFPDQGRDPACRLLRVFKELKDVPSVIRFVRYKHNLPGRFNKSLEEEAGSAPDPGPQPGRLDLRRVPHVTIDGPYAKDFDDAVAVEKTDEGYTLYVSIADVSHYVTKGSELDREAFGRGTSIYFPGTVIPMLPKSLSNGTCSLNPKEERLCVTAILRFTPDGDRAGAAFHESIIRSERRLTYEEVEQAVVGKDRGVRKKLRGLLGRLDDMADLARLLEKKRKRRGSIDFDLPEPELVLDMEGGIEAILKAERLFSHRIIEEFMIAANEGVAEFLSAGRLPAVFRVHEPPDKEKLREVAGLLRALSIEAPRGLHTPMALQETLAAVKGKDHEFLVNRVILRSMKQARYSAVNKGHFGLASARYLHFTSPIRRYPDLLCHRILKGALRNENRSYGESELEAMALHCSERERAAMEAERDTEDRIRILFMKEKVGEVYEGIISHVTSFGFFVELLDIFVEGIVLLTHLNDDYYIFQEEHYRLLGRRTRKVFRVGDRVRVRVAEASVERKHLHFSLVRETPAPRSLPPRAGRETT